MFISNAFYSSKTINPNSSQIRMGSDFSVKTGSPKSEIWGRGGATLRSCDYLKKSSQTFWVRDDDGAPDRT